MRGLRSDRTRHQVAATCRANAVQNFIHTGPAVGAFITTDASIGAARGQITVAPFAIWSEFKHRGLLLSLITRIPRDTNHYMPTNHAKKPTIAIFVFDGAKLLDATGPLQVFADARRDSEPAYQAALYSAAGGQIMTDSGLALPTWALKDIGDEVIDTLLISGGQGVIDAAVSLARLPVLADAMRRARRVGSICTGAFVLAASGHLDGRAATTHWAHCDELAKRHPTVEVRPDAIFVTDGPAWTSAGVSSGIDMALAMVEADLGRDEALQLARNLVLYLKRPGGQDQFSVPLRAQFEASGSLAHVVAHIRSRPADDLSVSRLAAISGLSVRTFIRRFELEIGSSPASFVQHTRVNAACEAFCAGKMSIKQVAGLVGFGGEERMRRSFQRVKGISPSEYRDRFGRR